MRLLCSEASIRRRIASEGDLQAVPGAKPLRVTAESVVHVQEEMLRRMGVPAASATPEATTTQGRVAELEAEVQTLRGALEDLTASNAAMLDTYRRLSAGAVPNN